MKQIPTIAVLYSFLSAILPFQANAQVLINEVMYNPAENDSGREWIELYNGGQSDVSMIAGSGKGSWRISDGSNHTLTDPASGTDRGSLTIPAGGYLVIANDPTDFISGEYAGGTYSVAKSSLSLSNNGTTVSLLDGTGAAVDSVAYSPTQGGSGDGSSLQRQADGSWISAQPTPGAANSNIPYVAPDISQSGSRQTTIASSTDQSTGQPQTPEPTNSYVPPPAPSLYADAGADRTVIVGADVEFDASAYDKKQTLLDPTAVRFMWNFGDGATAEGDSVLHHFSYPGRYAVMLEIANNKNAAMAQLTVNAQPAALSLALHADGGVDLENLSGHDLDVSGWIMRESAGEFAGQFMLPQHSKILAGSQMQISPQTLTFRASSSSMLEYPNGTFALAVGESSSSSTTSVERQTPEPLAAPITQSAPIPRTAAKSHAPSQPALEPPAPEIASPSADTATATDPEEIAATVSPVLETAAADSSPASEYIWWFGISALALGVAVALIAAKHLKSAEWGIVEQNEN